MQIICMSCHLDQNELLIPPQHSLRQKTVFPDAKIVALLPPKDPDPLKNLHPLEENVQKSSQHVRVETPFNPTAVCIMYTHKFSLRIIN